MSWKRGEQDANERSVLDYNENYAVLVTKHTGTHIGPLTDGNGNLIESFFQQ